MSEKQREAGRQELFSLMRQEHGVTCMESELTDIEQCVLSYALSHAEGEAVPVAVLIREIGEDAWFDHCPVPPNSPEHAAAVRAPELDDCVVYAHPAPRVTVPEEVAQALAGMMAIVRDSRGVAGYHLNGDIAEWDEFDEVAAAEVALAETPTAPAGEPECCRSQPCKRPGTGPCDMPAAQQPVSDPDGLTEPGRREAEQAYINCAFDYARDPIGSRDWVLFWNGWRARNAAPAPDEREIAALLEQLYGTLERATPPADESPEEAVADAMALLSDFMERADKKGGKS